MSYTAKEICQLFDLNEDNILNIYQYGSRVYGTYTDNSDYDYIVVHKTSFINGVSFKINARSSEDKKVQIIQYSRSGFIHAVNTYDMSALECLWLNPEHIIKENFHYDLKRIDPIDFPKQIIMKVSQSWHSAISCLDFDNKELAKKNIYHALRILEFALQIKNDNYIKDYINCSIRLKELVFNNNIDRNIIEKEYTPLRDQLFESLRN